MRRIPLYGPLLALQGFTYVVFALVLPTDAISAHVFIAGCLAMALSPLMWWLETL